MSIRAIALAAAVTAAFPVAASTFGPSPYLAAGDSPWAGLPFTTFILQDFDSAGLDTSTVSASGGTWLNFGALIDSVGGGVTVPGSWYSNNLTAVTFDFTAFESVHGRLPTHAGIVWTDVGFRISDNVIGGPTEVRFSALDADGNIIGPVIASLGDNLASGQTAEDRFFGAKSNVGIRSITLFMPDSADWEMDHLQYGVVPEASTWALLIAGFGMVGSTLRRRRSAIA
jgi:hypothetical protein